MSKYYNILFDLDGTITDSALGITNAVLYGIKKINEIYNLNIDIPSNETLRKFIGPPLDASFRKYCYDDEKLSIEFIKFYREDYNGNNGLFNCSLYDGIYDLIKKLSENNYKVFLATAKPKESALRIIEHFGMEKFFSGFLTGTAATVLAALGTAKLVKKVYIEPMEEKEKELEEKRRRAHRKSFAR